MKIIKPIAKFTLVTQILFPMLFSATSVASAVNTKQEKASHREVLAKIQSNLPELTSKQTEGAQSMTGDELLANGLNKSAQIISADNRLDAAKNLAQSTAYGFVSNQMTNWLNQYGNATIQISSDKAFSGEYFLPFYETEDNLFFSQSRIQRQNEDRTTLNLGLGYRYFMLNKMLGINSFYDHDLKNHNARLGLGAEFGADYIKLAANGYFRLTDWRESRLSAFHDYDERPANGFDIKAEGFLPSYPQLGANIKYEKYFGDKVNLKGSNSISDLKKDPQAYTVGISYTPVPLLSFSLNQSMGDVKETKGELAVNYRFGVPLSQQLDTDLVQQMRTLMGARYDAVERNNTIVMQYQHKEQELLQIDFDQKSYQINSGGHTTLPPIIYHKNEIARVIYESHNGLFNGIDDTYISSTNDYSADFNVPAYNSTSNLNTYEVDVYAVDVKGNRSNTVKLMVKVVNWVDIKDPDKAKIEALNESNKVTFTVTLKDSNNSFVTDKTVNIVQIDDNGDRLIVGTADKSEDGKYIFTTELNESGKYKFGFTVNGEQATSTVEVEYKAKPNFAKSKIDTNMRLVAPNSQAILTVTLIDEEGKSLKGKKVIIYDKDNEVGVAIEGSNGTYTLPVQGRTNGSKGEYSYSVDGTKSSIKQEGGMTVVRWIKMTGKLQFSRTGEYSAKLGYTVKLLVSNAPMATKKEWDEFWRSDYEAKWTQHKVKIPAVHVSSSFFTGSTIVSYNGSTMLYTKFAQDITYNTLLELWNWDVEADDTWTPTRAVCGPIRGDGGSCEYEFTPN